MNTLLAITIILLSVIAIDLSRRLLARTKKMFKEHEIFQTMMDAIPSRIHFKDASRRYMGCNKAFEEFSNATRDQMIGKTIYDFFHKERATPIDTLDERFLSSSEKVIRYETIQPNGLGEKRDYFVTKAKFYNLDGSLGGFVSDVYDITPQKNLERSLLEANRQLEEKNRQVMSSIEYAGRIQNAVFSDREEISEYFKEVFILFHPKHILSGDFYWFTQRGDWTLVAAADCTGHGVPGALITILGHELLNQIVYEQNLTRPDLILQILDEKLKSALEKRDPEHKILDGIDISLVAVNRKEGILQFSGAKNPLYFVREGKLEVIEGSRFEIGGRAKDKNFELHTKNLQPDDIFYIFSDGLQDQFGGTENRKLMIKGLQDWLLKFSHLPLSLQKQEIEKELLNWKGEHIQTDDILLMGVKAL